MLHSKLNAEKKRDKRDKGKEKEEISNKDVLIDIVEPEEQAPLLSRIFNRGRHQINFDRPSFTSSLFLKEIKHVITILKALQTREKIVYVQQKKLSRNSVLKKAAKITTASVGTIGTSLGSTVVGWTLFGIRNQQAVSDWLGVGDSFARIRNRAAWMWETEKIPGENLTCEEAFGFIQHCRRFFDSMNPFCDALKDQYCKAVDEYYNWEDTLPTFDGIQIFLVIFASLATLALLGLAATAIIYRDYFFNTPTIPAPPKNTIQDRDTLNNKVSDVDREKLNALLEKLERLSGISIPEELDALIEHLEEMARIIYENDQKAVFLFYLLENPRREVTDIHRFYHVAKGSKAPQLILDYLGEMAVAPEKDENEEQSEPTLSGP